jgi:hypothetical protein
MLISQLPTTLAAAVDPDFNSTPAVIPAAPGLNGFSALHFAPGSGTTNQLGNNLLSPINLAAPGQAFTVFLLAAVNSTNAAGTNAGPIVTDRQSNTNGAGKCFSDSEAASYRVSTALLFVQLRGASVFVAAAQTTAQLPLAGRAAA